MGCYQKVESLRRKRLKKMKNKKYGYHYTSYSLWLKIKKEGLIPYSISRPELRPYFPEPVMGIWTWINNLEGESHVGTVIFQMTTQQDTRIVKLKYLYDDKDILSFGKEKINLPHTGVMGSWNYHDAKLAVIVLKSIQPENIELIGDYNLIELLK